jgi:ectoine hydroxylase-related dioxygenase (phytanoyl-CoA dioxygenase family)
VNRVTPETPLPEVVDLFHRDGYVVMENALTAAQVEALSYAYDRQLALHPPAAGARHRDIPRILERDPVFEQLMDNPPVFRVAHGILGADIELATGGELDYKPPQTPAHVGWHNDFPRLLNVPYPRRLHFWVRCVYFMSDVSADMGPFTLLPGTHLKEHVCPEDFRQPPRRIEGQLGITGKAGTCLINNTEIWHTNWPNESDRPRRLIMLLYKHAWMKQAGSGYAMIPDFVARQTEPIRRQLVGQFPWDGDFDRFPAFTYGQETTSP